MANLIFREEGHRLAFVGNFDALYRTGPDPWDQSGTKGPMASYYAESRRRLGRALASHLSNGGARLEVGCGHGHALDLLNNMARGGEWHGLDISPTAIATARRLYPQYSFRVGDITGDPGIRIRAARYDATILNQVLWYVLERLDTAIGNCRRITAPHGLVIISQAFLKQPQRYGAEIADGFDGLLSLCARRYSGLQLIEAHYDDTNERCHHDGLLVFRRLP